MITFQSVVHPARQVEPLEHAVETMDIVVVTAEDQEEGVSAIATESSNNIYN